MFVIFVCLSGAVLIFLFTLCLTLFRIEKSIKTSLIIAERRILKTFSRRTPPPS